MKAFNLVPISLLMVEILESGEQQLLKGNKARPTRKYPEPATLMQDLKGVYAVARNTMELPLPISSQADTSVVCK